MMKAPNWEDAKAIHPAESRIVCLCGEKLDQITACNGLHVRVCGDRSHQTARKLEPTGISELYTKNSHNPGPACQLDLEENFRINENFWLGGLVQG
jgi:hypothetical protein